MRCAFCGTEIEEWKAVHTEDGLMCMTCFEDSSGAFCSLCGDIFFTDSVQDIHFYDDELICSKCFIVLGHKRVLRKMEINKKIRSGNNAM